MKTIHHRSAAPQGVVPVEAFAVQNLINAVGDVHRLAKCAALPPELAQAIEWASICNIAVAQHLLRNGCVRVSGPTIPVAHREPFFGIGGA